MNSRTLGYLYLLLLILLNRRMRVAVLGEYVGPLQWAGVACVLCAVLFAGWSGSRAAAPASA